MTASAGYSTSYEPASPRRASHRFDRSPSPTYMNSYPSSRRRGRPVPMAARVRFFMTPRVVMPLILWLVSIWLIHRYLFALPVPTWRAASPAPLSVSHLKADFPPPPPREGQDELDSIDSLYRPFAPLPAPEDPFPLLRPTRFLPKPCLESWMLFGELSSCSRDQLGQEDTLDAIWLWVNGTDNRWFKEMAHWSEQHNLSSPERHFREQNELKYSMRSVMKALKGHLRTIHLVLYDYTFEPDRDAHLLPESTVSQLEKEIGGKRLSDAPISLELRRHLSDNWRVVQTPQWLNFSSLRNTAEAEAVSEAPADYPSLRYTSHSEIFHLPTTDGDSAYESPGEKDWHERDWRQKALPTYNSMVIESRLGWIPGLADATVAMNDDFFLLRPLSVSDFHSPLFGAVIRFDPGYNRQVRPILEKSRMTDSGENGGLFHANYLLSKRYPKRLRPYFAHAPKVITRNMHHEASIIFKDALTRSGARRFREAKVGDGDVQMQWLLTMLRVERWREALLWTWIVANAGGTTGAWDENARTAIKNLFGLDDEEDADVAEIEVHRGERWTLKNGRAKVLFAQAGWGEPQGTEYLFSSLDGHLPPILAPGKNENNDVCLLDLDLCFGSFWADGANVSANDMFKRLTFEHPQCGDCMIMALVTASGPLGLSAFFPSAEATYTNPSTNSPPKFLPPPHLPLTPTWQETDFSLENVMSTTSLPGQEVNLQEYSMLLLSRYLYISGKTDTHFHMLKDPDHARRVFHDILDKNRAVTALGLNDDIERGYEEVRGIMGNWFESRWPEKAIWERS